MRPDHVQRGVEPGEHVRKHRVGMRLAGIEDDIGEDRYQLLEAACPGEEVRVQAAHAGPELNSRHRELAVEAIFQVGVQSGILSRAQLKILGDANRVGCSFPIREEGTGGLKADLVRDNTEPAALSDIARRGFREELTVENHHKARIRLSQESREVLGHVPSREDVLAQEEARRLIIFKVVAPQYPAQARKTKGAERNGAAHGPFIHVCSSGSVGRGCCARHGFASRTR